MALELQAQLRTQIGGGFALRLRKTEQLPAVLYGQGLKDKAKSLQVKRGDVEKILKTKLGKNTLVNLNIQGDQQYSVLIREIQGDVLTRRLTHVDFWSVKPEQQVEVAIETKLTGMAPGQAQGGIIDHVNRRVKLLCEARAVPEEIVVDISALEIGHSIHLAEVKLPDGVKRRDSYNPTIVAITLEKEEVVAEPAVAVTADGAVAPAVGADGKPIVAAAPGTAPGAAPGSAPGAAPGAAPTAKPAAGDKAADAKAGGKAEGKGKGKK